MAGRKRRRKRTAAAAADFMLAPAVVMMRLPLLAAEAQSSGGPETVRAVGEKAAAMVEGAMAAQLSMMQSAASFWPELLAGRTPTILNGVAVERSIHAALRPARKRLKANFRRLGS